MAIEKARPAEDRGTSGLDQLSHSPSTPSQAIVRSVCSASTTSRCSTDPYHGYKYHSAWMGSNGVLISIRALRPRPASSQTPRCHPATLTSFGRPELLATHRGDPRVWEPTILLLGASA